MIDERELPLQGRSHSRPFRFLDGALQNGQLMAECEDLKLKGRTVPDGSENAVKKADALVARRGIEGKRTITVYRQPDFAGTRVGLVWDSVYKPMQN